MQLQDARREIVQNIYWQRRLASPSLWFYGLYRLASQSDVSGDGRMLKRQLLRLNNVQLFHRQFRLQQEELEEGLGQKIK